MASIVTTALPSQATNPPSFNILDDRRIGLRSSFDDSDGDSSPTTTPDRNPACIAHIRALQETCINVTHNAKSGPGCVLFPQSPEPTNTCSTSLTVNLEKLRISELGDDDEDTPRLPVLSKKLPTRPVIGSTTFQPPVKESQLPSPSLGGAVLEVAGGDVVPCTNESLEPIIEGAPLEARNTNEISAAFEDHPLMRLPSNFANIEVQAAKTQAGQYELRLTYPASADRTLRPDENDYPSLTGETKIVYGCNFVRRNAISKAALRKGCHITDTVVLIASPQGDESVLQEDPKVQVDEMNTVVIEAGDQLAPATPMKDKDLAGAPEPKPSSAAFDGWAKSPTPSPNPKMIQIEDSVEALDKLEEELEAVNAVTHFGRVPSPEHNESARTPAAKGQHLGGDAGSVRRSRASMYSATVRVKTSEPMRTAARRSRSMSIDTDDRKESASTNGSVAGRSDTPARKPVARPSSLAPPKPLTKSSKARTVPTFELPGEAVARRLKEQKEARLSAQTDGEKTKTPQTLRTSFPRRTKSTRVLPTPTFELPGEAISRRKREERDAKVRAEEEEMRKRREFKARPIKASLGQPSTVPRETITSLGRLSKASEESSVTTVKGTTVKRPSLAPTSSTLSASPQSRGRATTASSQVSRATSISTTSSVSKRSTISAEDAAQQKIRGKDIFERDTKVGSLRDKERSEREMVAKMAREQAAERSRLASREWAEKQRRRARLSTAGAPAAE
ncbi:uncharacterized protein DNG_06605 [Cephalotrichum gorgonifer]|uniref:Carboxylesterase family protein n=1 Tax=Cephalotrichum gorgonifer TaxID=2041049 RepID=A0AAE8N0N4_9PEZI|nr:uncharacterized protein DNG_06605 [Cephalotrichum gorgonifer]